ncbi:MAG: TraM recognition domain-containing protein, partial [Gammaproteobacteria bacterium]|nr:TraM recognition domain-containing protein [Gammaproteobacteria bacterium]
TLPFRMPKRAKCKDYNSPKAGGNSPGEADGIYFLGNDRKTNDELWFTNDDMRTHVLIFGSTGSGKTEAMISLAYNALVQGSGFIYVDGKGDNAVFAKIFSLVRLMGREDDLLLINFMTGARDIIGPQETRLSNTMNPFSTGSSSMLSQLVVGLMSSSGDKSSGDMWKDRAIAFVEALMRVLVFARDAGYILLDANSIRNYFDLDRLETMVMDKVLVRDNQEPVSLEDVPSIVLEPMSNYLRNLPGYNKEKKGKQVSQVLEQHGYITMQLTRVFSSLADTYGHIIRTNLPEVDLRDVVLNRRILVVLLPALEKSPAELANLGKIIIASLKSMMAAGLGDEVEGMYSKIIERKPTNARNPFLCILDEYGYYAVEGFAVVPAQARSLGFSVVFAGQDLPAFQKASKEEAASIGANTNIKICMKLEDPMETWDFFMKSAGESHVSVVGGYQSDASSMTGQYMDSRSAQMEKRSRIDLLDLKEQREGEAHILFKSRIVRAKMFFANPKPVKELRLNQFVKVDAPKDAVLRNLISGFENFKKLVERQDEIFADIKLPDDTVKTIAELFAKQETSFPIEKGIAVLMSYSDAGADDNDNTNVGAKSTVSENVKLPHGGLDIFARLQVSDYLKALLLADDLEKFGQPILPKSSILEKINQVESFFGKDLNRAKEVADELIEDMHTATNYPPIVENVPSASKMVQVVKNIIEHIVLTK